MSGRRGIAHYNTLQTGGIAAGVNVDTKQIKKEFARNLQAAMIRVGWNQSELARQANNFLPKAKPGQKRGTKMGRDLISHYVRARMLPGPAYLEAIAKALETRPEQLLPKAPSVQSSEDSPIEMSGLPGGRVFLRIRRTVRQETALKIMGLLAQEDQANE